jgi:DNA repair exonuclease SbcCD ATPase subunit
MSLLGSVKRPGALPEIPPSVEEHPDWRRHEQDLARVDGKIAAARATIAQLTDEHTRAAAVLAEDRVQAALDDDSAVARVTVGRQRVGELERRLTEAREDLTTLEEARNRIAARSDKIQRRIAADLQKEVERVYRTLLQLLAAQFAALRPINDQLLELRHKHGQTSPLLVHAPFWGELSPRVVDSLPNKMSAWLAHAQELGIKARDS